MKTSVLHIFTRTPLHVGAGSSVGAIDMPIQRERHTQIPIIPGSSLKGVLRDLWNDHPDQVELFGSPSGDSDLTAGNLVVGEARVVCFPVRSAKGSFAWLTCPLALQRYARDLSKAAPPTDVTDDKVQAGGAVMIKDSVVLEEYAFKAAALPEAVWKLLEGAVPGDGLWKTLKDRLVVVSDGIFSHFCATACEVQQRVALNEGKTVENLFNQENVPSETLFAAHLGQRKGTARGLNELRQQLAKTPVIQIGGDETIGLGYCGIHLGE